MNKIKIGITGTGSLIGQAIIKSIANSRLADKLFMIGFDYFSNTIGSYWVKKNFLLPDFLKNRAEPETWLKKIIKYINSEDLKLIFIGLDFELKLFAKYKKFIESKTGCRVLVSDPRVIKISDDKYLTYIFLKDNNLFYPVTMLPKELNRKNVEFPCVVKPRFGWGSRDVFVVKSMNELKTRLSQIDNPVIQELIGSPKDEYTCGVIYLDNCVREMIALQRDLKYGNTIMARFSKRIPKLIYDYIYRISDKLKPFGVCNFQLRLTNTGIPKVFEINARHSGTTYIRSLFGYNEVEYILAYFLSFEIKKFKLKEGIVKRYYEEVFLGPHNN